MPAAIRTFEPGTLWEKVGTSTRHALSCGAIHTIPTRFETVRQGGVNFLIRIVANLARKPQAKDKQHTISIPASTPPNPFLPYDPDLYVADISQTHVCLLNKYNVLDHHILMVTRTFQEQESRLTASDCEALLRCLAEFAGLAFYNSGETAGASQRHKHLQMIPLPLTPEVSHVPIEPLLTTARYDGTTGIVPGLPFRHVVTRMKPHWIMSPDTGAHELLQQYLLMLKTVERCEDGAEEQRPHPSPYNLLATREWMFLVPRSTECVDGISINALGFAGGFLVKDETQLNLLKTIGPMTVLQQVGVPRSSSGTSA